MTQQAQAEALNYGAIKETAWNVAHEPDCELSASVALKDASYAIVDLVDRIAQLEANQAAPQKPDQFHTALDRFDAYFRSANGVPPNARISVPTAEWQELRAMLAAQAAPGWKLVPVEPTPVMMLNQSGCQIHSHDDATCPMRANRMKVWKHMIAAAPTPPAQERKPQFRLLARGELIQEGDEHIDDDTVTWHPVRKGFCGNPWGSAWQPMRRQIVDQAEKQTQGGTDAA